MNLIKGSSYCSVNFVKTAYVTFLFCGVHFLKIDNICEMVIPEKLRACVLPHKESHIKTDLCH
jgi:hypothetical protein